MRADGWRRSAGLRKRIPEDFKIEFGARSLPSAAWQTIPTGGWAFFKFF
jgi:hypothetical protein